MRTECQRILPTDYFSQSLAIAESSLYSIPNHTPIPPRLLPGRNMLQFTLHFLILLSRWRCVTLLFGVYSWVMSLLIGRTLGVFRHRVARRLGKIQPKRTGEGSWIFTPLDESHPNPSPEFSPVETCFSLPSIF